MASMMHQLFQMPTLEPQTFQTPQMLNLAPPQLQPMIHAAVSPCTSGSMNPPKLVFEGRACDFNSESDDGPPVLDRVDPSPRLTASLSAKFPPSLQKQLPAQSTPPSSAFTPCSSLAPFLQMAAAASMPSTVPHFAMQQPVPSSTHFMEAFQSQQPASSLLRLIQQQQQQHQLQQQINALNYSQLIQNFPSTLSGFGTPQMTSNVSQKLEPSISIEIKETKDPLLEMLMAQVASANSAAQKNEKTEPCWSLQKAQELDDDEEINVDDVPEDEEMPLIQNMYKQESVEYPDLPPSLEKVEDTDVDAEFDGDELPPELQPFDAPQLFPQSACSALPRAEPEDVQLEADSLEESAEPSEEDCPLLECPVLEPQSFESPLPQPDAAEAPVSPMAVATRIKTVVPLKRGRGRPKKLSELKLKRKSDSQQATSPVVFKPSSKMRESSTSSGVSSLDDCERPSCSPLAPINGNAHKRSHRPSKDQLRTTSRSGLRSRKRKSESPVKEDVLKKRAKSSRIAPSRRRSNKKSHMSESYWVPVGKPFAEYVHVENEAAPKASCCYPAVKHRIENVVFHHGDVICVSAGAGEPDNIGKINRIFRDKNGKLNASVFWYYRYDQCFLKSEDKQAFEAKNVVHDRELMASRHLDTISCDSIQSHAFVLTLSEYGRYVAENKLDMLPDNMQARYKEMWTRGEDNYPRRHLSPHEDTLPDLVYFCRRYYSLDKKKVFNGFPSTTNPRKVKQAPKNTKNLMAIDEDSENRFVHPKAHKRISF